LHDPEKGFKGNKEGLEFYVEHHPWKRLPAEVFVSLGGRDAAKEQRQAMLQKKADQAGGTTDNSSSAAAAAATDQANKTRDLVVANEQKTDLKTEDEASATISGKKRLLSEIEHSDTSAHAATSGSGTIFDASVLMNVPRLLPKKPYYPSGRTFTTPHFAWIGLDTKYK
jgi:hypothetical protein